ncbi:MAG: protease modulator HflK [Candidatus Rifleibacteriota bacterium]
MKPGRAFYETFDDLMNLVKVLIVLIFVAYTLSGISLIKPGEVGMILRVGRLAGTNPAEQLHRAGWLFAFPYPFDEVIRISEKGIREVKILELSGIEKPDANERQSIDATNEGYCISADSNIFQVKAIAKFQISDPVKAIFHFHNDFFTLDKLLHDIAVQKLSQISAGFGIDGILTESKEKVAVLARNQIQLQLDSLETGISLISFELTEVTPPAPLKEDFEEVNTAFIQSKKFVAEANGRKEELLPKAVASKDRILNEAHSYSQNVTADAQSKATSFAELAEAYKSNPEQIRRDLLEKTRKKVFASISSLVLIPDAQDCPSYITTVLDNGRGSSLPQVDMEQLYSEDQEQEQ